MAGENLPSGIWVRQALAGSNQVKITYIPGKRTENPDVSFYDKVVQVQQDLGWRDIFKDYPTLNIDEGMIFLRMSDNWKTAYLTWIPDDASKQSVETSHSIPRPAGGGAQGMIAYFACVGTLGAAVTPAVAIAVCSPAILLP